jgi:hypothetical protein
MALCLPQQANPAEHEHSSPPACLHIYIWFSFRHVLIIQIRTEMVDNETIYFDGKHFVCVLYLSCLYFSTFKLCVLHKVIYVFQKKIHGK